MFECQWGGEACGLDALEMNPGKRVQLTPSLAPVQAAAFLLATLAGPALHAACRAQLAGMAKHNTQQQTAAGWSPTNFSRSEQGRTHVFPKRVEHNEMC